MPRASSRHMTIIPSSDGFQLFKLFGFKVKLDWTWIFLAVLVAWTLAKGYFPATYEGLSEGAYWGMGIAGALGLFFSIIFHELSHSLVGRVYGMPISGIKLFIFGGIAEMEDEPPSAKSEFLMAIAGPSASLLIAAFCAGLAHFGADAKWSTSSVGVIGYLANINLFLAVFNMIPAFPLDGGRVLRAALWAWKKNLTWSTRIASRIGISFGLVMIAFGILAFFRGYLFNGIWISLIGVFLQNLSRLSYQNVLINELFRDEPIRKYTTREVISVMPGLNIEQLVESYFYLHFHKLYPVMQDGRLVGCVGLKELAKNPKKRWANLKVADIMAPCGEENSVDADEPVINVLKKMARSGHSRMLVLEGGNLLGIVTIKDLVNVMAVQIGIDEIKHAG